MEEKVLHLRSMYHLGPMRIVWYLARYHGISISDATVSRILKRHGVNRLPHGAFNGKMPYEAQLESPSLIEVVLEIETLG